MRLAHLRSRALSSVSAGDEKMEAPQGARVVVLEDEAIIAIDVENILTDAGLSVAGTLGSCADALRWLDANDAEVALLDMHLFDGSCEPVSRRLAEKGIPFVVFSATRKRRDARPYL